MLNINSLPMKRIIIITICLVLCGFHLGNAQAYSLVNNVKTPHCSVIPDTYELTIADVSYTSTQLLTIANDLYVNYNGAELIDAPSNKYNCHAYAWHVSEGGNKVWIGYYTDTAEDVYWTDGSYIEVPENESTKVSYHQDGNHSAIRLNSTWYQSKWGPSALVKHHPNDVPSGYKPSMTKKYYKLASIIGPDQLCLTTQTYSLPAGCLTGNWSVSGSIQFDTQNTTNVNSVTVKPSAYSSSGTLKAVASNGLTYVKSISTCTNSIIGSEFVCSSATYTTTFGPVSSWSKTEGSVNDPFFTLTPNGNSATVTVSPGSPYQWATLKAVVNGLPISKEIWTHAIAGPETICYSFNYSLTTGETPYGV